MHNWPQLKKQTEYLLQDKHLSKSKESRYKAIILQNSYRTMNMFDYKKNVYEDSQTFLRQNKELAYILKFDHG